MISKETEILSRGTLTDYIMFGVILTAIMGCFWLLGYYVDCKSRDMRRRRQIREHWKMQMRRDVFKIK